MMEACCSRFTAAEGGARLAAAAATKNILAVEYASFIPVRLLYEKAYQIRGSLSDGSKRSVYITRASRVQVVAFELKILTDLANIAAQDYEDVCDWAAELDKKEVIICTSSVLKRILEAEVLTMSRINVLIVDSCHLIYRDEDLKYIMKMYKQCPQPDQPTILALTYPLFTATKKDAAIKENTEVENTALQQETAKEEELGVYKNLDDFDMYEKLEWKIEELEDELCCQMDLAEDIDGGKRMLSSVTKPRELIIEYGSRPSDEALPAAYKELEKFMLDAVQEAMEYIEDHRHDPTEIYGEELYEEFMNIPDPTIDPKQIFKQFLYVLEQLGPYAADKAAFALLLKLEKLKVKIPYERHFLLLCLSTTVFIKIRCYADLLFSQYEDEWEKIKTFSTPKLMRFAEILEKFQPPDIKNNIGISRSDITVSSQDIVSKTDSRSDSAVNKTVSTVSSKDTVSKSDTTKKMLKDIEKCDFMTLGNTLQDKVNTYESNLKEIYEYPTENLENIVPSNDDTLNTLNMSDTPAEISLQNKDIPISGSDSTDNIVNTTKTNKESTIPSNTSISTTDIPISGADIKGKPENNPDIPDNPTITSVSRTDIKGNELVVQPRGLLGFTRRTGHRLRGRTRIQRNTAARVLQMQQNPDALCGIVFMKEPLIAKILFMIIVDMTRSNTRLTYLCAQYCATENPADPGREPRECQRQGKKQEEVLKKFRMHECNLLLATSALEEGIDLPRCNLVLRWDVPASYRSYGLCRGRARASRATAALLCSNSVDTTQMLLHNVATYRELDQIISRKCGCGVQDEPPQSEEDHADTFTSFVKPYTPKDSSINSNTSDKKDKDNCKDNNDISNGKDKSRRLSKELVMCNNKLKDLNNPHEETGARINSHDAADAACKDIENIEIRYGNLKDTSDASANFELNINNRTFDKDCLDSSKDSNICTENSDYRVNLDEDICKEIVYKNKEFSKSSGSNDKDSYEENKAECSDFDKHICKDNTSIINTLNNKIDENPELIENKIKNNELCDGKNTNTNSKNQIEIKCTEKDDEDDDAKDANNGAICNIIDKTASLNINDKNFDINHELIADVVFNKDTNIDNIDTTLHNCETGEIEVNHDNNKSDNVIGEQNHDQINDNIKVNENQEANIVLSRNDIYQSNMTNQDDIATKSDTQIDIIKDTDNIPVTDYHRQDSQKISENDILSKVYCYKCFNVKIANVCLCGNNVTLYYKLLAKSNSVNINKCDNKKNISDSDSVASVDLSTAIALINRYCGKLPSDTFTRLAPQWWLEEIRLPVPGSADTRPAYICTLRLPLNCPVKYNIVGHPMPTKVLARRMVALQACRILHKSGELDNQLMPIGKENFKAAELENSNTMGACSGSDVTDPNDTARPGTTKRRQYYYKRTAWAFTDCQPVVDTSDSEIEPAPENAGVEDDVEAPTKKAPKEEESTVSGKKRNMLYAIVSKLWCALPERYNTRGRRLHAPQNASQAIGILMARHEPDNLQIPAFPVYTRSGEVRVSVEHVPNADVRMSPRRGRLVRRFMRFVFAEVLRVRRRGMKLQSEGSTHNNYYIVPTVKIIQDDGSHKVDIDWAFLELIYQHTEDKKLSEIEKPILWQAPEELENKSEKETSKRRGKKKKMANPLLKNSETFLFDSEKYKEAVVTPWYRNQDQPQFFLVAEICWNLTPDSSFPSVTHQSFRDYYSTKYGVTLTQRDQPLLDVDHTSARLNLLTPRYVNRKGVALPVSSERTRRAKRDRLDQKQILIPELCRVHPFAAPLWFATVALPCVLYRINALLIADEIRRAVAIDVGLGIPKINEKTMPGFQWPALDFGWSLAEVLSADSEKNEKKKEEDELKREQKEKELKEKEEQEQQELPEDQKKEKEEEEDKSKEDVPVKTLNDILQEKLEAEAGFEIGTWSNDMASSIPQTSEYDELMEPLPPNLTFCTSASGGTNWCDPIGKPKISQFNPTRNFSMADSDDSYLSSDLDSDDTDLDYDGSDDDTDASGFCNSKNTNAAMGVRIEYKTAHEAEAVDLERNKKVNPAPMPDEQDDLDDRAEHDMLIRQGSAPHEYIEKFRASVLQHKQEIIKKGHLIKQEDPLIEVLPDTKDNSERCAKNNRSQEKALAELFPYGNSELVFKNGQIDVESIERNKRVILEQMKKNLPGEEAKKLNCFSMKDINIDSPDYVNEKIVNVGFDNKKGYEEVCQSGSDFKPYYVEGRSGSEFDFDYQPKLEGHPGPSPSVILQALTMSNANDGINLERLETIGDSFLKFAITAYLYCAHPTVHEGKLSHMRSKQVSNLNLYRLGRNKRLGARMIASKFEPHDNWLPPCHKPPPTLHPRINNEGQDIMQHLETPLDSTGCFIPYNLITQHSIPDKSIADCVEALIGAYLLECGPRGALLFMSWLGIRVLPCHHVPLTDTHPYVHRQKNVQQPTQKTSTPPSPKRNRTASSSSSCSSDDESSMHQQEVFPEEDWSWPGRAVGSLHPYKDQDGKWMQPIFGELKAPPSPLLRYIEDPEGELEQMLSGYDALERTLQYRFKDRSLLLQALTHASHHSNRLTDCYQRLEFLGDAILDYLITRHLYEDPRRHSPGALTDLRSALVNNTIFATLAARHGFHKYFRHMSPGLNEVLTKYVKIQEENGHSISEEHYLIQEDEMEQAEDVEVPKALGDLFESVAGAIFLDSGMSLGAVWKSYVNLMGAELEAFSAAAPKSPVRELLEAEPDTAKFGKPERLADGRRVRVCVEVFGRGTFKGVGRNYRIAKGTAARCALRHLRVHRAR